MSLELREKKEQRVDFSLTFSSLDSYPVVVLASKNSTEEWSDSVNKIELSSNEPKGWLESSVCLMLD